jgi:protein-L-isoaspartate(D-aspartate) O-methyltransferase
MRRATSVALLVLGACSQKSAPAQAVPTEAEPREQERLHMVSQQIEARGVRDARVLTAMRKVPRHRFVPRSQRTYAYQDRPLPIDRRQTISQPYIVALMSYQAAVLAEMGVKVFSIEIIEPLAEQAKATLLELGYGKKVEVRHGDGYAGWPEHAPFDAIVVTAAPPKIPEPLKEQLKVGGHLVIPVGKHFQSLLRVTRTKKGFREESVIPVRFVPMTGKAQEP